MKLIEWLNTGVFKAIGWSIMHSVWQSLILLVLLKIVLTVIRKKDSGLRYFIAISFLSAAIICTVFTFQHEYNLFLGDSVNQIFAINAVYADTPVRLSNIPMTNADHNTPGLTFLNFLSRISPYLATGWIIGLFFYTAKIVRSGVSLNKLRKLPTELHSETKIKLNELSKKMEIKKPVGLIITDKISEPFTFGFFKPVILLPFSYAMQVPMEELEMVLAHELSHIKRNDYVVNLIQSAFDAIYFFNPFFQSMSNIVRNEREYCCDDMASASCGNQQTMAIALTNLKVLTSHPRLSLSVAPEKNAFYQRVYRLIDPTAKFKSSVGSSVFSFIILAIMIVLLTKCVSDRNGYVYNNLPQSKEALKQLLADNQAGHKIEVFGYEKESQNHEIFLVSTFEGDPLYAYLDGNLLSLNQLSEIHHLLNQKKTISESELMSIKPTPKEIRTFRSMELNREIDSIGKIIKTAESDNKSRPSTDLEDRLSSLQKLFAIKFDEIKTLAMDDYKDAMEDYKKSVKYIPTSVELHELLTKIITSKEFNQDDRKKLNELILKRQAL